MNSSIISKTSAGIDLTAARGGGRNYTDDVVNGGRDVLVTFAAARHGWSTDARSKRYATVQNAIDELFASCILHAL